jgi:hypothetical protein
VSKRPVLGGTSIRIRFRHFNHMFLCTVGADVLQMTAIEIINVIAMSNGRMATARPVDVRTRAGRLIAGWHCVSFRHGCVGTPSLRIEEVATGLRWQRAAGANASD